MKKSFSVIPAQHDPNTKNNSCFNTSFPLTPQSISRRVPEAGTTAMLVWMPISLLICDNQCESSHRS